MDGEGGTLIGFLLSPGGGIISGRVPPKRPQRAAGVSGSAGLLEMASAVLRQGWLLHGVG